LVEAARYAYYECLFSVFICLQELYAQSPHWLSCSLANARRGVVTGLSAPRQGYMVMGHVHAWHLLTSRFHKTMLRKVRSGV
jgi:hypothetical protein